MNRRRGTASALIFIVLVSLFVRFCKSDPKALLSFEEFNLFAGVDFVLSFFYQLDEPGFPPRPSVQHLLGGRLPPLELQSPLPLVPWVPAKEGQQVSSGGIIARGGDITVEEMAQGRQKYYRPLGANYDMPLKGRTVRGLPKTFHNIGIQCNAPASPTFFLSGLLTLLLGKGVSNFSLDLMDPFTAARLPTIFLATLSCVLVFFFVRTLTASDWTALAAALFLALEPMSLAESRRFGTDTAITFFVFLTLIVYFYGFEFKKNRWRLLAGVCLGLALVTKVQGALVPVTIVLWRVMLGWLGDDVRKLRRIRIVFLVVFLMLIPRGVSIYLGAKDPDVLNLWGGRPAYMIGVVSSYLFLLAVTAAFVFPIGPLREEVVAFIFDLKEWFKRGSWRQSASLFLRLPVDRYDVVALGLAPVVFVLAYPNIWGNPIQGFIQHWFGFYGGVSPFRDWFFVTATRRLPVYFYLLMIPLHANELFLLSLLVGFVWTGRYIQHHKLESSRSARGLLLVFLWLLLYFLLAASGGAYQKMSIAISFYPWLSILAGMGLFQIIKAILFQLGKVSIKVRDLANSDRMVGLIAVALILLFMVPPILSHAPYFYLYYNHLLGNPQNAARIEWLPTDIVSGYERAAEYIQKTYGDDLKVAAIGAPWYLSFYYDKVYNADGIKPTDERLKDWDLLVVHVLGRQRRPDKPLIKFIEGKESVETITINGIDVFWIYDLRELGLPHE